MKNPQLILHSLVKSWVPSPQDQHQVENASPFVLTISTQHCAGGAIQGIHKGIKGIHIIKKGAKLFLFVADMILYVENP